MSENASTVKSLVNEISSNLSQKNASRKDEVRVMQAMLSDPNYEVNVYGKEGIEESYNPTKDFRAMCASVIANAAKISNTEAEQLMENYSVRRTEASAMVNISKEFINTYLQTGRKLPLGGREKSDVSIMLNKVDESVRYYPKKVGVNDDGSDRYSKVPTTIPAHESIAVHAPCPDWIK